MNDISEFNISQTEDQRVLPSSMIQQQKALRRSDLTASQEKLTPMNKPLNLNRQIEIYQNNKLLTTVEAADALGLR